MFEKKLCFILKQSFFYFCPFIRMKLVYNTNAVKFFCAVELMNLLADRGGWMKRLKASASFENERMPKGMV
jgi:hypothetical protein